MGALLEFLQRNQILKSDAPPLCHTTEAYFLKKFISSGKISVSPCDVFRGEKLSYFFVGRPAFKRALDAEAEYWELPICIIIDFKSFKPKRVFPFDTGAFKSRKYPSFIGMMDINEFEVSSDPEATEKIIGTFFVSSRNYFNLKARAPSSFESLFDVDVLDEEVKALHKLVEHKDNHADDRRFAIEFQKDSDLNISADNVLAVIVPENYIASTIVSDYVENKLGAKLLSYPVFPLKKDYYYYAIYQLAESFLKKRGHFRA